MFKRRWRGRALGIEQPKEGIMDIPETIPNFQKVEEGSHQRMHTASMGERDKHAKAKTNM